MKRYLAAVLMVASLAGCASTSEPNDETRGWTVEKIYGEAKDELNSGNYTRAIKLYETLQARYPYGRYAQQALMDQAYTHYKDQEPELALAAANRFIRLYPAHPNLDYMYYLKGLVYYNDDSTTLAKWAGQDMSERDPRAAHEAFNAFRELTVRFPQSPYSADATEKMQQLVAALGGHQMHVARYYMKRGAWLAAANRAQDVVKEYSNTGHNEEALAIMVVAYDKLGMKDLSADASRVLKLNYPNSQWLQQPWQVKEVAWWKFW
ncbi:outer membrane protein assembly factor BamD [Crenobacter caeni]|uniref:Outer membrane protein assembly factor BamD n=1 Tax=Crenobacter caeni TaxID=2705474 RepID=A0A6B2KQP6_9NEIS|nr:outer membrane protein assembly factor BamD [Crenobacter caeni]NDV12478.1 outer membrane protein assembly factor BamD [Crenobacter caeni]